MPAFAGMTEFQTFYGFFNFFCIFFTIYWYAPAEQPPPKLAMANKILSNGESVKWSLKSTDPIKQILKKN
jgi:hypothetical protein